MGLLSNPVSVLWVVPLLCLTVGAVLVTVALRQSTRTAVDLRDECARLGELRTALVDLRSEADRARGHVEGFRRRASRDPADRYI